MERKRIGRATFKEMVSACCWQYLLGIISPKTRIIKVITPVTIPTALPGAPLTSRVTSNIARLAAAMLARLFPMRIVINHCDGFINRDSMSRPFFPFSLISLFTVILSREERAISDPEKKLDNPTQLTKSTTAIHTSLKWIYLLEYFFSISASFFRRPWCLPPINSAASHSSTICRAKSFAVIRAPNASILELLCSRERRAVRIP
ncbi:hypothetical protein ES703_103211 [subsurface metagenome]